MAVLRNGSLTWVLVLCLMCVVAGCPSDPPKEGGGKDASEAVVAPDEPGAKEQSPRDDGAPDQGRPDAPDQPDRPDQPPPDGVPNAAAILLLEGGNNQRGEIGKPLVKPLTVRYIDRFEKGVEGVEVVFAVLSGGGTLDGGQETTITTQTDKDGRASVTLQLGDAQGFQRQVVQVQKKGDASQVRTFVASGFVAGPPEQTAFSGGVLNNKAQPLPGVTVYLVKNNSKSASVKTDKDGRYTLTGLKDYVGQTHLVIDGTTEPSSALYPKLEYEVFNIAGIDNRLDGPASLPQLDPAGTVQVDESNTTNALSTRAADGDMTQVSAVGRTYRGVLRLDVLVVKGKARVSTLDELNATTTQVTKDAAFQSHNTTLPACPSTCGANLDCQVFGCGANTTCLSTTCQ